MKIQPLKRFFVILPLILWLSACAGTRTFTPAVRAGDTVALAVGWQKNILHENLTVTITPSSGSPITYLPNDENVRGIINLYPDPSSGLVVGTQTNRNLGSDDNYLGGMINSWVTGSDREWWQTTIFMDLPPTLPTGLATITFVDSTGTTIKPVNVEILPGAGSSNLFNVYFPQAGSTDSFDVSTQYPGALSSLERTARYAVSFTGAIVPHSIQVEFSRTPNIGKTWVVNPRGDIKNVVWRDNGTTITVILTPTQGKTLTQLLDYKFYIAGGITGLIQTGLKAYDVNGNLMSGITATVQ